MQDREFEKQVRQKMQELRFAPNSDVWARVQADIRKKKRRRPLIIFLLLAGLIAGSAWVYFGVNWNGVPAHATIDRERGANKEQIIDNKQEINNNQSVNKTQQTQTELNIGKNKTTTSTDNFTDKNITASDNNISKTKQEVMKVQRAGDVNKNDYNQSSKGRRLTPETKTPDNDKESAPSIVELLQKSTIPHVQKPAPITAKTTPGFVLDSTFANKQVTSDSVNKSDKTSKPEDIKKPIDSLAKKPFGAKTNSNKKKTWEFGASAGVGYANAKNGISFATSFDNLFSNSPTRDTFGVSPNAKGNIAFNVGGYASKSIGKRLRIKAGLNYEYYSTSMQVGNFVDSSRAVNLSTGNLGVVSNYYRSGDQNKYSNRYHFVSVPVSIQWQVNRNAKRSIVWENGISLARLVGTNALQYDPVTRSYYEDKAQQNKTQWMASSAVLFRFATKDNRHMYAGPTVQYGLTNLTKDSDNKHLRYAGLKMMMSLNKK
jgi:hypothetical protein